MKTTPANFETAEMLRKMGFTSAQEAYRHLVLPYEVTKEQFDQINYLLETWRKDGEVE